MIFYLAVSMPVPVIIRARAVNTHCVILKSLYTQSPTPIPNPAKLQDSARHFFDTPTIIQEHCPEIMT
jgi:hypothetical protein